MLMPHLLNLAAGASFLTSVRSLSVAREAGGLLKGVEE